MNFDRLVISQNPFGTKRDEPDFRFLSFDEKGLSKSRNRALDLAEAEIVMIADDDLEYCEGFWAKIKKAFNDFPEADGITFKIITPEGAPYKPYPSKAFKHSRKSIFNVSSVEMVFRLDSLKKHGIRFDENFGLGAKFKSGEETIILNDALDKGLNLFFVPENIVIHPLESSGKVLDENFFYSKGALIKRMFHNSGFMILGFLFLMKQVLKSQNQLTLAASIKAIRKGFQAV
ncbi:glycosyltransferase family 2 protein [Algoriphagus sediminis]|uniref:Glycosyltransferase family A protein n=1 Tax=Algoriphagus sediminis TaxID=3057113 RepID=A0ABT7YE01_9BACT|nr:glycosyltransferase family A protein [Algoriphagus sediminis]MDN3204755.1 glycosyltransferase family A protein [Algoriphagus sediminis]